MTPQQRKERDSARREKGGSQSTRRRPREKGLGKRIARRVARMKVASADRRASAAAESLEDVPGTQIKPDFDLHDDWRIVPTAAQEIEINRERRRRASERKGKRDGRALPAPHHDNAGLPLLLPSALDVPPLLFEERTHQGNQRDRLGSEGNQLLDLFHRRHGKIGRGLRPVGRVNIRHAHQRGALEARVMPGMMVSEIFINIVSSIHRL